MDAALALLRLQGVRIFNYMDDWLILAQSQDQALGFSHDAGTSVSRTCTVITDLSKSVQDVAPSPRRLVSQTVGSDGSGVPCS